MSLPESLRTLLVDTPGLPDGSVVGPAADPRARQQVAIWAFSRRASVRPDLELLKQDAVSLVTEILDAELGGISEVTPDGAVEARLTTVDAQGRATPVAAYRATLEPTTSMAAYAMTTATAVVSKKLVAEKRFTDLLLREQGVVAGLVVPLPVDDKPSGTIGVFCRGPREFTEDDVRFAETIAHLLSSSIARSRAEEQFRLGKSLADAVLESIVEMVFTLDADGRVMGVNRAAREKTGYDSAEVRGRPLAALFLRPAAAGAFQDAFRAACSGPARFSGDLLTKKRELVPADWQFQSVKVGGRQLCIVLTVRETPKEQPLQAPSPDAPDATPCNLRTSPRRSYQYRQRIAPMYTAAIPTKRDFFEVECKDISAGGVSFCLECEPDFTALVVGLGRIPDLAYFTARVARVSQETINGKLYHVVGCRFTGRVHL